MYWPGSGVYIEELDLLEVGDHVVFGSRSEILCTDAVDSAPVKLGDGCMVADRCVLLPGVTVGKGVTLGSGTLAGQPQCSPFYPLLNPLKLESLELLNTKPNPKPIS